MTDRLSELHRQLAEELGHIGLHVRQMEASVGVMPDEHVDDEGNVSLVPRVDLLEADDPQEALTQGVKSGDVMYGIDVICSAVLLALVVVFRLRTPVGSVVIIWDPAILTTSPMHSAFLCTAEGEAVCEDHVTHMVVD